MSVKRRKWGWRGENEDEEEKMRMMEHVNQVQGVFWPKQEGLQPSDPHWEVPAAHHQVRTIHFRGEQHADNIGCHCNTCTLKPTQGKICNTQSQLSAKKYWLIQIQVPSSPTPSPFTNFKPEQPQSVKVTIMWFPIFLVHHQQVFFCVKRHNEVNGDHPNDQVASTKNFGIVKW